MAEAQQAKCLECKRPVYSKWEGDVLLVAPCSNCIAKAERDAARDADGYAREEAARALDERRW